MKKIIMLLLALSTTGCITTVDLAQSLHYSDNRRVGINNIQFAELQKMKQGKSCMVGLLVIPLFGDNSVTNAARKGNINAVELIGQTENWYFPFISQCTVVYGDNPDVLQVMQGGSGHS